MIIVKFTSGLGNQMFQYSLYMLLREKYPNTRVLADLTWFGRSAEHQGWELSYIFGRCDNPGWKIESASAIDILRCTGRFPNTIKGPAGNLWQTVLKVPHNIIRLTCGDKFNEMHIDQSGYEDNARVYDRIMAIDPEKNWYISGFFIEEVYYRDRISKLREVFTFDETFEGKYSSGDALCDQDNRELIDRIRSDNSVSIHVRRGDYLSAQYNTSFISLPMEYYKKAVSCVLEENPDAVFYIFSDDKEYIESAFEWIENKVIVSGNTGRNSYRDMQLMSLCRTNIIANSTFSQWAGLLNSNENARVYYPKTYMRHKDSEIKSLQGWIRV